MMCLSIATNKSGAHSALIRRKPKAPFRVDGGSSRDRLALTRRRDDRRLALDAPGSALHRIGTKARFIPEVDLRAHAFGRCRNARIDVALPSLDRCRVTLIGTPERLLGRQSQVGKQLADRGEAQSDAEPVGNQLANYEARPQTKIKSVLTRILTIDPTKYLPLLRFR